MDIHSLGSLFSPPQIPVNPPNGPVDSDGDHDNSKPGEAEGSEPNGAAGFRLDYSVSFSAQAQQTQGRLPQHTFSADHFFSRLDTSNLTDEQKQALKDILDKYDGTPAGKGLFQQLVSDLKNAGFDVQKLFANFAPRQGDHPNPEQQGNFSTTV